VDIEAFVDEPLASRTHALGEDQHLEVSGQDDVGPIGQSTKFSRRYERARNRQCSLDQG
jgi:hypothetical protein